MLTIDYGRCSEANAYRSLFELRGILEVEAAALAANGAATDDLDSHARSAGDMTHRALWQRHVAAKTDLEFHRTVAAATGNPYMVPVPDLRRPSGCATAFSPPATSSAPTTWPSITLGEHERIFAAIRAGDVEGAQAAMRDHLAGAALRVGLHEGEAVAEAAPVQEVASPVRHSRLRKAVRGLAGG